MKNGISKGNRNFLSKIEFVSSFFNVKFEKLKISGTLIIVYHTQNEFGNFIITFVLRNFLFKIIFKTDMLTCM